MISFFVSLKVKVPQSLQTTDVNKPLTSQSLLFGYICNECNEVHCSSTLFYSTLHFSSTMGQKRLQKLF